MVYSEQSHLNGWSGGTPISGTSLFLWLVPPQRAPFFHGWDPQPMRHRRHTPQWLGQCPTHLASARNHQPSPFSKPRYIPNIRHSLEHFVGKAKNWPYLSDSYTSGIFRVFPTLIDIPIWANSQAETCLSRAERLQPIQAWSQYTSQINPPHC